MSGIKEAVERVLALYRSGDLVAARNEGDRALGDHPDSPQLVQLAGLIRCRAGEVGEGAVLLRRALALDPGDSSSRLALANALLALGALDEAEQVCRPDAFSGPAPPAALRLRGYILQSGHRFAEAARCYEQALEADPDDWQMWNNLGNALRDAGDLPGAIRALERARAIRPDLPALHFNLGLILAGTGRLEDGAAALQEAVRLGPDARPALLELGKVLRHLGRPEEALAALDHAAALEPTDADIQIERGRALAGARRFDESERAYQAALGAQPGLAEAYLERGLLLERCNRLDELDALLDEADAADIPAEALSHLRALALDRAGKVREALAAAVAAPAGTEPVRRLMLVGRLADKAGGTAAAFQAYADMNRLVAADRPGARQEADAYRSHVAALTDTITPAWFGAWKPADAEPERRPAPVFLVGFPRSGTTLLDTMLMGHPAVHLLEEEPILERVGEALGDLALLPELDGGEVRRLRDLYFAELDAFDPAARGKLVVDKLPLNILGAPLIHRLFPDARLIFAERHPCDVVLSCFMQNFELNPAMANFLDLGDAARLYDLVLSFWRRSREILPLDVHTVRYEALVENKEQVMRPLLQFLGLPWDDAVVEHQRTAAKRGAISTPSYAQVAQPIYRRASGRWLRYRAEMADVLPILAPWAEWLGYSPLEEPDGKRGS